MTTGPTDGKVTTAAGGPDGMPLALKFNEGLGHNAQDLTGDVAWLWTHCRALGMARKSDSGLMRDDVALYVAELHSALIDFVVATRDIKRWAQGHFDGMPDFKCSGPWPEPITIESECRKLRAAYEKHAGVGVVTLGPNVRAKRATTAGRQGPD